MTTRPIFYEGATLPFRIETSDILAQETEEGQLPLLDATAVKLEGFRTTWDVHGNKIYDAPVTYTLAAAQIARISLGTYDAFHRNAQRGLWFWKTTATIGGRDSITVMSLQVEAGPG